jgi:hypothetical protein
MRLTTCLLVLLIFTNTAAQEQTQPPPTAKPRVNKRIHMPGEYRKNYDRFTDETMVMVGPFTLGDLSAQLESGGEVRMSAAIFYKGQNLAEPVTDFFLLFYSRSKEWEFLRRGRLYVLADGERFSYGEGMQERDVKRGSVTEALGFLIPRKDFEKLAGAKKVEMRLGTHEFTLSDNHVLAFGELLDDARPK